MKEITYVKRGSAGQGTGVLYDEVICNLQPLLIKHGIVVTVDFLADGSRLTGKGNYIYEGYFDVHYINIDKPEDKFTSKIVAHAMDSGDKAPGKAITYASKIAHLKTFGYETGDNDESRAESRDVELITPDQVAELSTYLVNDKGFLNAKGEKIAKAYKIGLLSEIKASKFDKVLQQCVQK